MFKSVQIIFYFTASLFAHWLNRAKCTHSPKISFHKAVSLFAHWLKRAKCTRSVKIRVPEAHSLFAHWLKRAKCTHSVQIIFYSTASLFPHWLKRAKCTCSVKIRFPEAHSLFAHWLQRQMLKSQKGFMAHIHCRTSIPDSSSQTQQNPTTKNIPHGWITPKTRRIINRNGRRITCHANGRTLSRIPTSSNHNGWQRRRPRSHWGHRPLWTPSPSRPT
jgi:hypothetical protein